MAARTPAWLIVTGWGALTLGAFWHLEWRYLRPVARPAGAAVTRAESLPLAPLSALETTQGRLPLDQPGPVTWLNFWNPDCACSRFTEARVQRMAAEFRPEQARLVTIVECGETAQERAAALTAWRRRGLPSFRVALDPGGQTARAFGVWAAPAAVVLDRRGRVAYVGAYNAARFCDNPATAWASQALKAIISERRPPHATTPFYGCQVTAKSAAMR